MHSDSIRHFPIISEEYPYFPSWDERKNWDHVWLVDPLDGTREFIKGSDDYTVNIALIEFGVPVLGVVYAPAINTLYYATKYSNAFKQVVNNKIKISSKEINFESFTVVGSKSWRDQETEMYLSKLPNYTFKGMGSSLKPCLIAEGAADLYVRFGTTCEWDTAASHCILSASGGEIFSQSGAILTYNQKEDFINPPFIAVGDLNWNWKKYL